jgi:hypothetical protein
MKDGGCWMMDEKEQYFSAQRLPASSFAIV